MNALARLEKRAELVFGVLLAAVALLTAWLASRALAPAFDELPRLASVEGAERLVLEFAARGSEALSTAKLRTLSPDANAPPALALLFAGWTRLSLGRLGLLDPLICARLPWLIAGALAPLFVYAIVRPSRGRFTAVLAAALLLFQPRWLHAVGIATEAAALAGLWLLAIALHLRAEAGPGTPRRRLCWAAGAAVTIGAAAALSAATFWLVALLLAHHWAARRGSVRRLLRRGRLPVPASLILGAALAPLTFFASRPELLSANVMVTLKGLLAVLAPSVQDALFLGRMTGGAAPPVLRYGLAALLWTVPTALLLAAAVGLGAIVQRALARRFASGRLRPPRDRHALGALVVLGLAVTSITPAFVPGPLLTFPPRLELVLPFVAIAAALGVDVAVRRAGPRRSWAPAALFVAALAFVALRDRSTSGAAFAVLGGGAERVAKQRLFAVGDGSELGTLAPRLDALGPVVAIAAPEVPEAFWQALKKNGRINATVTAGGQGARARLERGVRQRPIAVVERDGAVLWSLVD